jgi:ribonucleoside-diphosphate reductase alpha chain
MDSVATLTSIALQYGVPLDSLVRKFSHQRYEPSGFTKNPEIRNASSITDYVFRWMGLQFIPGFREATNGNRAQQELAMPGLLEEMKKKVNRPVPALLPMADEPEVLKGANGHDQARGTSQHHSPTTQGFVNQMDAPLCAVCGHVTVRNGACYKCLNCGESQGCS